MFRRFIKTEKHRRCRETGSDLLLLRSVSPFLFIRVHYECVYVFFGKKSFASTKRVHKWYVSLYVIRVCVCVCVESKKKKKREKKGENSKRGDSVDGARRGGSLRTGRCTDIRRDRTVIYIIIRELRE